MKFITSLGLAILAAVCLSIYTAPVDRKVDNPLAAVEYLEHFGYLEVQSGQNWTTEEVQDAIRLFQSFANITVTGEMDNATMEVMNIPRCGVPDMGDKSNDKRRRRYVTHGSKWRRNRITYKITIYISALPQSTIDQVIARAFNVWEERIPLTITRADSGRADIEIFAGPIDGRGGTLAQASFPRFGGDVTFDDDERFTDSSHRGTNFFQVAAHEFGHSLGLDHSNVRKALMAPFYSHYNPDCQLHSDDIMGITSLYGTRDVEEPDPTPTPNQNPDVPDQCSGIFDAITSTADGTIYAFRDQYYWTMNEFTHFSNPKQISDGWPGLPDNIDAAVYWKTNEKTYFFKGDRYWRFSNRVKDSGYPKSISIWGELPSNIDAAFVWGGNGWTYFIKGSMLHRFTPGSGITYSFPKVLWLGLPDTVDAAFQYSNGKTFFFSGDQYYRFNDATMAVDAAFPRPTARRWLEGCRDSANLLQSNQMVAGSHAVLPSLIVIYCSLMLKVFL